MRSWLRLRSLRLAALATGAALILGGCDSGVRSTVETGIISVSSSFFAALLQALLQVAQGGSQSAHLFADSWLQWVA